MGATDSAAPRRVRRRPWLLATALVGIATGGAVTAADDEPNVVPPPPPEALTQGEPVEPRVTITRREDGAVVKEYRAGGRVYAMRIEPRLGPAYYLYDVNGDGLLEARYDALREIPNTIQWRLFSW